MCRRSLSSTQSRLSSPYQSRTQHVAEDKSPVWALKNKEITDNAKYQEFEDALETDAESYVLFPSPCPRY